MKSDLSFLFETFNLVFTIWWCVMYFLNFYYYRVQRVKASTIKETDVSDQVCFTLF